jgi:hypothetical protein
LIRGVCYFFGIIFILGGLLFLVTYSLLLGLGGIIIGIILIALGHKAGGGNGGGQGGGRNSGGGGEKKWWELTDEQKKAASWYYTWGPGSWGRK